MHVCLSEWPHTLPLAYCCLIQSLPFPWVNSASYPQECRCRLATNLENLECSGISVNVEKSGNHRGILCNFREHSNNQTERLWTVFQSEGANSGEHRVQAYNGGLGRSPQRHPGAEPLSGGRSLPEAETLLAFGRSMEAANLPTYLKSRNTENHVCCLANVAIVPYPPTFIHYFAIYGLWNGTLFPRNKLLLFDVLQLCCSLWHARCVCCPSVRLWVSVILWLNNAG